MGESWLNSMIVEVQKKYPKEKVLQNYGAKKND